MARHSSNDNLVWFLAGAAIGAAAAVLYAPSSGRELRQSIASRTGEGKEQAVAKGRELYERGRGLFDQGRQIVDDAGEMFEEGRRLTSRDPELGI